MIQSVFQVRQIASILLLLLGIILWRKGEHMAVASAVRSGGLVTSGVILMVALIAVFAWQFWFNTLHLLFFQAGSWLFSYSNTLIRLFPVKLWFDATLSISIISLIGGPIMALLGYRWRMTLQKAPRTVQIWFILCVLRKSKTIKPDDGLVLYSLVSDVYISRSQ